MATKIGTNTSETINGTSVARRTLWGAAVAILVGIGACPAKSDVPLFVTFPPNTSVQYTTTSFVDFNGPSPGGTLFTFSTTKANQRVLITFQALCQLDNHTFVSVRILVDPAGSFGEFAAPPTNSNNGQEGTLLCTDFADVPAVVHTSVVASAKPSLAGSHTVRVQVVLAGAETTTTRVHLNDATLSIER